MRSTSLPWILAALVALPVLGESRIRVENTSSGSSRLNIGFADTSRNVAQLKIGSGGVAELVVDAPSPKLRLSGGTLQTDPAIELIARRQLREQSAAPTLYVVDSHDAPAQFVPFDGPLVYDDWAGYWSGGYYSPAGGHYTGGARRSFGSGRGHPGRWSHGGGSQPSRPSSNGGTFRASGMIHRPSR